MQSSYLARKSSHSAMPIFSPLDEDLVVDGLLLVMGLLPSLAIELLLFDVSVLLQPIKKTADRTAKIKKVRFNIWGNSFRVQPSNAELLWKGIEKAAL